MNTKKVISHLLLAFVYVSIGVAIGKEWAIRSMGSDVATTQPTSAPAQTKTIVYYMHGIPCVTCTFIETTTEQIVAKDFADAVASGAMEFVSLNYLEPRNAALADKYSVASNTVIAARFENGREVSNVRLDGVMEFADDADRLKAYLREGIDAAIGGPKR